MILFINIQLFLLFSQNPQFSHIHTHNFNSYQLMLTDYVTYFIALNDLSHKHTTIPPRPQTIIFGGYIRIILSVHMYCKCKLMNELILMNFDTLRMSIKEDNHG